MKKNVLKIIILVMTFALVLPFAAACSGNQDNNSDQIVLKVDFQSYNPTFNTTPTAENPIVVQATKYLAEAFMRENPDIVVEFDYSKSNSANRDETSQWMINGIETNTLPAISFSWGTTFQDRDYYVDLTDYFNAPNPYVEGNERWRDLYYDNIFYQDNIINANGRIVAVPLTCSPGAQTGFYYNKNFFKPPYGTNEEGFDFPTSWESMITVANQISDSKKGVGYVSWPLMKKISLSHWFINQNLAPALISENNKTYGYDYDNNGYITTAEQLRGVRAGIYNPLTNEVARELFRQIKRYFTTSGEYKGPLTGAWQEADYSGTWASGGVAMMEDGAWSYQSVLNQAGRTYEFGFAQPFPILKDTTQYAPLSIEYTESGPYAPECNFMLNIMKPTVKNNPELLAAAVKFLQFMTTPDSLSLIAEESGSVLGAAKDSTYSRLLEPILSGSFPKLMKATWPLGFTTSENDKIDRAFVMWLNGQYTDTEFYTKLNELQLEGANKYITAMNIDTSNW